MEEKLGLITGIECRFIKTDPELLESIAKRIGSTKKKVKAMMRYNVFTISQFSDLSKLDESTIINKTRPSIIDRTTGVLGTALDYCFPFSSIKSTGAKFIVRNEKSERYLKPKEKE